jgi:hypothetical protein
VTKWRNVSAAKTANQIGRNHRRAVERMKRQSNAREDLGAGSATVPCSASVTARAYRVI